MAVNLAYEANIELSFLYKNKQEFKIKSPQITYLMIEHLYESQNVLPVIYINLNIQSNLYTKVSKSQSDSKFKVILKKRNALNMHSVYTTVIDDTFNYVSSTDNPNPAEKLNENTKTDNDSYMNITIGLVSEEMTNKLRVPFNSIEKNTTNEDIVNKMVFKNFKKNKIIMEPLKNKVTYDTIILPPVNSRYKLLKFLFDKDPFYDTFFTFYMDFDDTIYLVSKEGNGVKSKNGSINTVIIDIKDVTAQEAFNDGFTIKNGAYYVYVNSTDANVTVNEGTDKVMNNIVAVNDLSGTVEEQNVDVNKSATTNTSKKLFMRSKNMNPIKNEYELNSVMLQIIKQNVDSGIFTPNKVYKISNLDSYSKYNGNYILSYKKEFYKLSSDDGRFIMTCNLGFKRVANSNSSTYNESPTHTIPHSNAKRTTSSKKK